jgi:hypothetical protein
VGAAPGCTRAAECWPGAAAPIPPRQRRRTSSGATAQTPQAACRSFEPAVFGFRHVRPAASRREQAPPIVTTRSSRSRAAGRRAIPAERSQSTTASSATPPSANAPGRRSSIHSPQRSWRTGGRSTHYPPQRHLTRQNVNRPQAGALTARGMISRKPTKATPSRTPALKGLVSGKAQRVEHTRHLPVYLKGLK